MQVQKEGNKYRCAFNEYPFMFMACMWAEKIKNKKKRINC